MRKKIAKMVGACVTLSLVFACGAMAAPEKTQYVSTDVKDIKDDKIQSGNIISSEDADKKETVYVIANADGTPNKIIVSELLNNRDKKASLDDVTNLSNICNLKSDAGYTMNGNCCTWDAQGEKIYYRGETDAQLPVSIKITFKLDGREVTPQEIAGATGRVDITFTYTNNCKAKVDVNGKEKEVNVPFLMLSGMILNNDNFKNISIDNGKLIDDGDKTIVAGYVLSGIKENFDSKDVNIPESFTISADATDFSLATTVTVATNSIFCKINPDELDSLSGAEGQLDVLEASMKQLVEGSSQLYGYLRTLLEKSGELTAGVKSLVGYADELSTSVDKLYSEGITVVGDKIGELNNGLNTLSNNSEALRTGSSQVFDTLIATVNEKLKTAGLDKMGINVPEVTRENYGKVIDELVSKLSEDKVKAYATAIAKNTVTKKIEANTAVIEEKVTEAVRAQVEQKVKAALQTQISSEAVNTMIESQIAAAMNSDEVRKTIAENTKAQKEKLIAENMASDTVQSQINASVKEAKNGAAVLSGAKASLDSYNTFYEGLNAYTAGVDSAASGSSLLREGYNSNIISNMKLLDEKLSEYAAGMHTLGDNVTDFNDAVLKITDGAETLSAGTDKFYKEGIMSIVSLMDTIAPNVDKLKATIDAAKKYQSFGGKSDDMSGETKIIYRTEAVEK